MSAYPISRTFAFSPIMATLALLAFLLLSLTACNSSGKTAQDAIDERRAGGGLPLESFEHHLREGYIALSDWEWRQQDYPDTHYYGDKARIIMPGNYSEPEFLETRNLPTDAMNEVAEARNYIMSAFARGARNGQPFLAARTQYMFDCWLEQQEENFQPVHIDYCKREFLKARAGLEAFYPTPVAAPATPEYIMPEPFLVFFDFNKSTLTQGAKEVLNDVIKEARYFEPTRIYVSGHTDTSGSGSYNEALSKRRSKAVAAYLAANGINHALLDTENFGELKLRVPTPDGTKAAENRYARIVFVKPKPIEKSLAPAIQHNMRQSAPIGLDDTSALPPVAGQDSMEIPAVITDVPASFVVDPNSQPFMKPE